MLSRVAPRAALRVLSLDPREFGLACERIARRHLAREGWRALATRLWAGDAEFDLLLARGDDEPLVVCEVKSRRVPLGADPGRWLPLERIDRDRRARLASAARRLARDAHRTVRVDAIEVLVIEGEALPTIAHHAALEGPFEPAAPVRFAPAGPRNGTGRAG